MKTQKRRLRKGHCLVLLTLCLIIFSFSCGVFSAQADDMPRELQPVIVRSGDTLWDLVTQYYQYSGDIRAAIYEVREINDMEGVEIYPGQLIYIPAR